MKNETPSLHNSRELKHDIYGKQYASVCYKGTKIFGFQLVSLF